MIQAWLNHGMWKPLTVLGYHLKSQVALWWVVVLDHACIEYTFIQSTCTEHSGYGVHYSSVFFSGNIDHYSVGPVGSTLNVIHRSEINYPRRQNYKLLCKLCPRIRIVPQHSTDNPCDLFVQSKVHSWLADDVDEKSNKFCST